MNAHTEVLMRRAAAGMGPQVLSHRRPRVKLWIAFSLAVVVAFFGLIISRVSLDQSAFVLEELERQITEEEARRGALRVELARLQSPERISGLAVEMGLVYPARLIALEAPADSPLIEFDYQRVRPPVLQAAQP